VTFDIHTMLYAGLAMVLGVQSMLFWIFAKVYGARERIVPADPNFAELLGRATLERGLVLAGLLLVAGIGLGAYAVGAWQAGRFGDLDPRETMRLVIPSAMLVLLAFHVLFAAFFIAMLGVRGSGPGFGDQAA
jgi:hypothetical protein